MRIGITVTGLDQLTRLPPRLIHEAPFVAAVGLTKLASESKRAIDANMRSRFDRPTLWTMRGIGIDMATKERLISRVGLRDESLGKGGYWSDVLGPQFVGGSRQEKRSERSLRRSGWMTEAAAIPSRGWRTDPFGNMPRARIVEILAWLDALSTSGSSGNMGQAGRAKYTRKQAMRYFVARQYDPRTRHLDPGVYAASDTGDGRIAPALLFTRAPRYRQLIDLHAITRRVVDDRWADLFVAAMERVVR